MSGYLDDEYLTPIANASPWVPPSLRNSNILALYDPNAHKTYDFGGQQTLTAGGTGSVSYAYTGNGLRYARFTADAYLEGEPWNAELFSDGDVTIYVVGACEGVGGADLFYPWYVSSPNVNAEGLQVAYRLAAAFSVSSMRANSVSTGNVHTGTASVEGIVAILTCVATTSTLQIWEDGDTNGPTAHSLTPGVVTALDRMFFGGGNNIGVDDPGSLLYCIVVQESTRSTTVEAELSARFTIGEDLTP